jgi:hypothetical protein
VRIANQYVSSPNDLLGGRQSSGEEPQGERNCKGDFGKILSFQRIKTFLPTKD